MDENNRNFFLAIGLSILVLLVWQVLFIQPELDKERAKRLRQAEAGKTATAPGGETGVPAAKPGTAATGVPAAGKGTATAPGATGVPGTSAAITGDLAAFLKNRPHVAIDTPSLKGSISLKGARIDDLELKRYRVTVDPNSANVRLFSPAGTKHVYFAEHGWSPIKGLKLELPTTTTVWQAETKGALTPQSPVILRYETKDGLIFRRTFKIDENYMITVRQSVENKTGKALTLQPYARINRVGRPTEHGLWILHEGLIGVGKDGEVRVDYDEAIKEREIALDGTGGWIGITDKYWAAVLVPDQKKPFRGSFVGNEGKNYFQTHYLPPVVTVPAGGMVSVEGRVFAGAKETHLFDKYEEKLGIKQFDLMIDWGWFYFITRPLFYALDYFYRLIGNFGVSILIVTVIVKLLFFPLANKSYSSMSKMKKLQPEMERLRERFKDDKVRLQQGMMELYKKEGVSPLSGCLPILLQIPVFFALYKVLYVTIEMRHAPFFGWIQDLSAKDPTSLFNLFGLLPYTPPDFLGIGVWPVLMGISMFVQMRLNPAPADPIQQKIFTWMPLLFTFMLAPFAAGLVIYWTWNNVLSIAQQWVIMRRQGVEVNLLENMGLSKLLSRFGARGSGGS